MIGSFIQAAVSNSCLSSNGMTLLTDLGTTEASGRDLRVRVSYEAWAMRIKDLGAGTLLRFSG